MAQMLAPYADRLEQIAAAPLEFQLQLALMILIWPIGYAAIALANRYTR
jgi:hypothetical protein